MIVDAQIHLWEANGPGRPWPAAGADGRTATPQRDMPLWATEALQEMKQVGVDRAFIVPPSWEGDRNDVALRAAADDPARFAVMGRIAPHPEMLDLLPSWRTQPDMLGARLILSEGDPRVPGAPIIPSGTPPPPLAFP
jgi:L-fuconolactonase